MRNLSISPEKLCDSAFIYCIGYEMRSRFVAQEYQWSASKTIAVEYTAGQVLSFDENKKLAKQKNFEIISDQNELVETAIGRTIVTLREKVGTAKVAVDVSSMDRSLMSRVLLKVLDELADGETMYVLYSPSAFYAPRRNLVRNILKRLIGNR